MSEAVLSVAIEEDLKRPAPQSLMTPLGMVEGEVLEHLSRCEETTLRRLNQALKWPAYMVMMAVGALIRAGLVRGAQYDLEVVVTLRKPLSEFRSS